MRLEKGRFAASFFDFSSSFCRKPAPAVRASFDMETGAVVFRIALEGDPAVGNSLRAKWVRIAVQQPTGPVSAN